jgi:hypothetical protein
MWSTYQDVLVPMRQRERDLPADYLEYNCRYIFDHWVVIISDEQENNHPVKNQAAILCVLKNLSHTFINNKPIPFR